MTGLRNGDTLSGLSNAFGIDGLTNAGSYTLNVLGTFSNPNYVVTRNDGVWTVNPAQITVTANGGNSVYGQSPVNPGLSVTGLLNGDSLSGLSNSFGITNLTGAGSHTLSVNGTFGNPNYVVDAQRWHLDGQPGADHRDRAWRHLDLRTVAGQSGPVGDRPGER